MNIKVIDLEGMKGKIVVFVAAVPAPTFRGGAGFSQTASVTQHGQGGAPLKAPAHKAHVAYSTVIRNDGNRRADWNFVARQYGLLGDLIRRVMFTYANSRTPL